MGRDQVAGFCEDGNEFSSCVKERNLQYSWGTVSVSESTLPNEFIHSFIHLISSISIFWNVKPYGIKNSQRISIAVRFVTPEKAVKEILRNDGICLSVRNSYWLMWIQTTATPL